MSRFDFFDFLKGDETSDGEVEADEPSTEASVNGTSEELPGAAGEREASATPAGRAEPQPEDELEALFATAQDDDAEEDDTDLQALRAALASQDSDAPADREYPAPEVAPSLQGGGDKGGSQPSGFDQTPGSEPVTDEEMQALFGERVMQHEEPSKEEQAAQRRALAAREDPVERNAYDSALSAIGARPALTMASPEKEVSENEEPTTPPAQRAEDEAAHATALDALLPAEEPTEEPIEEPPNEDEEPPVNENSEELPEEQPAEQRLSWLQDFMDGASKEDSGDVSQAAEPEAPDEDEAGPQGMDPTPAPPVSAPHTNGEEASASAPPPVDSGEAFSESVDKEEEEEGEAPTASPLSTQYENGTSAAPEETPEGEAGSSPFTRREYYSNGERAEPVRNDKPAAAPSQDAPEQPAAPVARAGDERSDGPEKAPPAPATEADETPAPDRAAEVALDVQSLAPPPEAPAAPEAREAPSEDEYPPPTAQQPEGPPSGAMRIRNEIESVRDELRAGDGHLEALEQQSMDGHTLDLGGNTPIADISNWMRSAGRIQKSKKEEVEQASPDTDAAADEALDVSEIAERDRVVAFLLRGDIVTPEQVRQAQQQKEEEGLKEALWRVLAQREGVDREAIFAGAARVYAFPVADLDAYEPNTEFTRSVMETFTEEQRDQLIELHVIPLRAVRLRKRDAIKLYFITHDPARPGVHRLMRDLGLESFSLQYAPEAKVNGIISDAFPKKNEYLERIQDDKSLDLGANYEDDDELLDEDALEAEISRSKLINLFEATLVEAVREGASDIHIYPNADKQVEVHFRIDGRLAHWHTEDKIHPEALLAVIKDNSMNVDRFERDAAQDGFIQRWVDDALIRFRVSVLPIANASQEIRSESIVIRVLDDRKVITDLSKLGLLEGALEKFEHAINQPHGMVILTGPTGSGKSTTLVASLHSVVSPEVNVLTIEDPVEYIIPDVRQIKLNHKLQLDQALRAILRHDPDVVMVGEMRDRATAELAIKLANTGHLTFSTLHTNDAPSAISRLYKMDIEPFLIAYAINLVVAQRLIRTLCPDCKQVDGDPDPVMLKNLGFTEQEIQETTFYVPGQDDDCKTCRGFGYKGRRAVAEALYFSREIRHMIVEANRMIDEDAIRDQAQKEGMLTLQDSAREVVKIGETDVREMIRVVTSEAH